jgi:hypothetical protein
MRSHSASSKQRSRSSATCPRRTRRASLCKAGPPGRPDAILQLLWSSGHGRATRTWSGVGDQDIRRRRTQAGRRRAGLEDVRPRPEEQSNVHRQHGEALSTHRGDRRQPPQLTSRVARQVSTSS